MVMLFFLRMMADLGAYYAFGGAITAISGGGEKLMGVLMLQSAAYALSCLPKKRSFRLLLLPPVMAAFFLGGIALPDRILILPATAYLFYLAWVGDNALSWSRHVSLFKGFLYGYIPYAVLAVLLGAREEMLYCSLPYALIMLAASVLLMRALRHDESVYSQTRFLLINGIGVLLLAISAFLMSTEAFRQGCELVFGSIYKFVIAPVLLLLLCIMGGIVAGIGWLLSRIRKPHAQGDGQVLDLVFESAEEILGLEEMQQTTDTNPVIWIVITTLIVLTVLFFFFRWLARRHPEEAKVPGSEVRITLEGDIPRPKEPPRGSPVQKVRAVYRKFLKLCERQGMQLEPSTTSKDVEYDAQHFYPNQQASGEMREIYIAARYGERAEKADVARMKTLLASLKKNGGEENSETE